MATVNVTIKNVDRLVARLNNISKVELQEKMAKAVAMVHGQAKLLAPVNTGNLASSIHQEVRENNDTLEGRVFTNVQYAPYVEFGTGSTGNGTYPYDVKGLTLTYRNSSWVYTPDGETFFRTSGQVAQPFMYPALKQNEKYIQEMFKSAVKNHLAQNCKGGK